MITANTDYIQATIELFGAIITVLGAMIFWIITGLKKKSEKYLFSALLISGLGLLVDAGWYIFDGNTSNAGFVLNWICNFTIFICNPVMAFTILRFLSCILTESKHAPNKVLIIIAYSFIAICALIPISNIFYGWMYYFTNLNVYVRNWGWYLYTAFNSLSILSLLLVVILKRKYLSLRSRITFYIFFLAPFLGIALQAIFIGISFIQIGIAISSLGIVLSYILDWVKKARDENDITIDKKRLWLIEAVFSILILFVSASIISCVVSVNNVSQQNSEQNSKALTYMVAETVDAVLSEPVNVSRTMANSEIVLEALESTSMSSLDEEKLTSFMKRIKNEYGYQSIFIAKENDKSYYTPDGFSRYMELDGFDAWYNKFKEKNIKYELNIDNDKDNDMALSVFINVAVNDEANNIIGACGVAMSIENLMDILDDYEKSYSLDVMLVDSNGIIQVDFNKHSIGSKMKYELDLSDETGSISYLKNASTSILTKYMNVLDWHLIIIDKNPNKINVFEVILPSMVIYVLGVILMVTFSLLFGFYENRRSNIIRQSKRLSETDGLTNLYNRYSLDRYVEKVTTYGIGENLTILMIDINGLKTANDTLGHDAGDELIKATAELLLISFKEHANIYRVGGDEFFVISEYPEEVILKNLEHFNHLVSSWKGHKIHSLSVSIGCATHTQNPDLNINELIKVADNQMYQDKNQYYIRTGKTRRK